MVIQSLEDWNILESQLEQQKKNLLHLQCLSSTRESLGPLSVVVDKSPLTPHHHKKKKKIKINLISSKHFYSFSFLLFFDYILRIYIVQAKKLTLMRTCILPNLSLQISAYKYQILQKVHKILIGLFQNTCEVLLIAIKPWLLFRHLHNFMSCL